MTDLAGLRVAITGASSGIGEACANAYAREGCRVAVSARRVPVLQQVADDAREAGAEDVHVQGVDVTEPGEIRAWADALAEAWDGVDVVVANAGIGQLAAFLDLEAEQIDRVVETNVTGLMRTVHAFGDPLEESRGQIVAVSSMIHAVPTPYMSVYVATKAAVTAWARSVRPELARRDVDVTLLMPGATRTGFAEHALTTGEAGYRGLSRWLGKGWSADRVARACVEATRRRRGDVPLTLLGRLGSIVGRLMPNVLARSLEPRMRPGDR